MSDETDVRDDDVFPPEDGIAVVDNVHVVLRGPDGEVKQEFRLHNTVTTAGKNGAADQVIAVPTLVKPGWMAIGTGSPAATLLGTEVARVAFTSKTRSNAVVTMVGDFAAGTGTGAITEAGTFDVVTANTVNMWMSASFTVVNKLAADSLSISWTLTFAQMALVDVVISEINGGTNAITLTYDNGSLAVTKLAWVNQVGYWTWTVIKAGQPDLTRTLQPGDSGTVNVPAGYTWAVSKGQAPNFTWRESWFRENPAAKAHGQVVGISVPLDCGSVATQANLGTQAFNTTATVPSGAKIWVCVGWFNAGGVTLSSIGGGSLTWTIDQQGAFGSVHRAIVQADAPSGLVSGTTLTATFSAGTSDRMMAGMYSTGVMSGTSSDYGVQVGGESTQAWATASGVVTSGDILIGCSHNSQASGSPTDTASGGNTEMHDITCADGDSMTSVYQMGTGASIAASGTWSVAGGTPSNSDMYVAYTALVSAGGMQPFNPVPFMSNGRI